MNIKILCLLIFLNSLQTNARGFLPILKSIKNITTSSADPDKNATEHLNLPSGFEAQTPLMNPLLYYFVTEQSATNKTKNNLVWRPAVMDQTNKLNTQLTDSILSSTEPQNQYSLVDGPVLESIVYGAWKPEPPVQPNLTQIENVTIEKSTNVGTKVDSTLLENVIRRKIGGFIEDMGNKKLFGDYSDSAESIESFDNLSTPKKQLKKNAGRRKLPINHEKKRNDSPTIIKIVKENSIDPILSSIVKQINESVEETTKNKANSKESEDHFKQFSREWPTDFMNSSEGYQREENSAQNNIFNFSGNSSEPPQALNGLNVAVPHTPPNSINITKMGVPNESQNSGEDAPICVPISVREPAVSNPMEFIEVERVYCFPLPVSELKSSSENIKDDLIYDKDIDLNILSYEELSSSSSLRFKNYFCLTCMFFTFIFLA